MPPVADVDLPFLTGVELAAAICSGHTTSVHALEVMIARAALLNPAVNAVVVFNLERARARAAAADAALARGEVWGPLHGLPITVKENNDVEGLNTTVGNPKFKDRVATRNEVAVQRLEDAGCVIWGKTNLPIDAMDAQSYNELFGETSNPWDLTRTPGGSSGGGAAAVAAAFTPFDMGSDVLGSVRIPASFTGVFGHKATFGLFPKRGPNLSLHPKEVSVRGVLARGTEDLKLLTTLLAQPLAPRDGPGNAFGPSARAYTLGLPRPRKASLREYRVAIWADDPRAPVDDELAEAAERVAQALERAGARVDRAARPRGVDPELHFALYLRLAAAGAVLSKGEDDGAVSLLEYRQAQVGLY
jgi:amidase